MKKLICIVTFLLSFSTAYSENYAVLVGIEDYQYNEFQPDLDYAVNDALLIKDMLIQVADWSPSNIKILTDNEATESAIYDSIAWMETQADDGNDVCLFYFSGHGYTGMLTTHEYYPLAQGWINQNELYSAFSGWDTDKIVIILEACYSANFNGYIQDGVLLMSDAGEYYEDDNLKHSPFTYFLAKGMAGYADLTSDSISAEDIFDYADDLTTSFDPSIVPVMDDDYSAGDLEFLVKDLTLSGTLSHDEIWSGSSLALTGNVTVPSGKKLTTLTSVTVGSGKTLTLASGSTVNVVNEAITKSGTGAISVSGGAAYAPGALLKSGSTVLGIYSSAQAGITAGSSGNDVHLAAGTYNESITMKEGVDVIGAGISSTTISGWTTFDDVDDLTTLSDLSTTHSIMLDDCIGVNLINISSSGMLDINDSAPYIEDMELTVGYIGMHAHNYGYADYEGGEINGNDFGIYINNIGTVCAIFVEFCVNEDYDVCADGLGCSAEAILCVWSGDPWDYICGSVDYEPYDICGLKKAISASETWPVRTPSQLLKSFTGGESDPGREAYYNAYSLYRSIRNDLRLDIKSGLEPEPRKYATDFLEAIVRFKQIVAEYPGNMYSVPALGVIANCYWALDEPESVAGYLGGILKDARYESLHLYAQNLLIPYHQRTGDIQAALDLSDTILSSSPPEDLACDVLYGKGVIYQHHLGDHDKAVEMFLAVLAQYPDHPTALAARDQLERMGESVPGDAPTEPETVEELALEGYPNPFNPTATIRFGLPEGLAVDGTSRPARVTLVVYDLLGREVVRLIEGYRDAGWLAIVWDGRDAKGQEVPTGIYIARIVTPRGAKAIKLVMMK